jgi:hypothetical protein
MFRSSVVKLRIPAYRAPPWLANPTLMSEVAGPPGTIVRSDQVAPPSLETKTGARCPLAGSGVNAVATI